MLQSCGLATFVVYAQVHTLMEESATACVAGDFAQGLEKAKEAVSTALFPSGPNLSVMSLSER